VGPPIDPTKKLGKIVNSILITTSCYASGCVAFGRYIKSQTSTKDEHSRLLRNWPLAKAILCRSTWGPRKPSKSSRSLAVTDATAWSSGPSGTPMSRPRPQPTPRGAHREGGRWAPATARRPSVRSGRVTEFLDVSCPSEGNCVAVGLVRSTARTARSRPWSRTVDGPTPWTHSRLIGPCSVSRAQRCVTAPLVTDLLPSGSEAFVSRVELVSVPTVQVGKAWTVDGNSRSSANLLRVTVPRTVSSLASWTDRTLRGTEKSV